MNFRARIVGPPRQSRQAHAEIALLLDDGSEKVMDYAQMGIDQAATKISDHLTPCSRPPWTAAPLSRVTTSGNTGQLGHRVDEPYLCRIP